MTRQRRQQSAEFKAKVALEAIRGERTIHELAAAYGVHPVPSTQWKKVLLEEVPTRLSSRRGAKATAEEALQAALSQQIGQVKVERDGLKKKLAISVERKRALVEPEPPQIRLRRPCAWLGLARGHLSDHPVSEGLEHLALMRWLDEPYTATPFSGSRRMTAWLQRQGDAVHHTRVGRLLRQLGLAAIDPKARLSQPAAGQTIDPSLVRGVTVGRVNQVWSAAITDVPLAAGLVSLVAVIAWCSR
ncbi:MAG: IS3 family transposase [Actinomycetota bacterium]|nr:IS3 family transposase [Actinomycetota bacterium]